MSSLVDQLDQQEGLLEAARKEAIFDRFTLRSTEDWIFMEAAGSRAREYRSLLTARITALSETVSAASDNLAKLSGEYYDHDLVPPWDRT